MKKVYFVTGLAVLAVSAAMFTGCGSKTSAGAPATKAPAAEGITEDQALEIAPHTLPAD